MGTRARKGLLGLIIFAGLWSAAGSSPAVAAPRFDPLAADQVHVDRGVRSAWRYSTGAAVTVAVIDSGVNLRHPDLAANVWANPGEVAGNGVDDDGNGFVDDRHGWDWIGDDPVPEDAVGHGTHVAGVIAARARNGVGGTGVAPRARIMALRVLDARNAGVLSDLAAAIDYAVAEGARVINVSVNASASEPALERSLHAAWQAGVLVVASTGNDGSDLSVRPSYPACSPFMNVIAVGSIGLSGRWSRFSNRGGCLDVVAVGEDVLSTSADGGYEMRSGTSMAAPQVAGVAALAASRRPDLRAGALRAAVLGTARARRSRAAIGARRVDAARTVRRALRLAR